METMKEPGPWSFLMAISDGCVFTRLTRALLNFDFKLNLTLKVKVNNPPKQ